MKQRLISYEQFVHELNEHMRDRKSYSLSLRLMGLTPYISSVPFNEQQRAHIERIKKHYRKAIKVYPLDVELPDFDFEKDGLVK